MYTMRFYNCIKSTTNSVKFNINNRKRSCLLLERHSQKKLKGKESSFIIGQVNSFEKPSEPEIVSHNFCVQENMNDLKSLKIIPNEVSLYHGHSL